MKSDEVVMVRQSVTRGRGDIKEGLIRDTKRGSE